MPKQISYRIQGIDIIEKILSPSHITPESIFHFNIKSQTAIDGTKKLIIVLVEVTITIFNQEKINARFTSAIGFTIDNFDEAIEKDDKEQYILPTEFENLLKNISISTMRGIVFSELRGTVLHGAIMPVININSFEALEGSIVEEIKKRT